MKFLDSIASRINLALEWLERRVGVLPAALIIGLLILGFDMVYRPGNRLEALRGDRAGQYSIRINDKWRICFEWPEAAAGPMNVEIVDYH